MESNSSERFVGSVKWFNNRNGFGFITASDGSHAGKDIFVHHSAIQVSNDQYRYLCQGEYVEFNLASATSGKHDIQATNITGVKGGKLMCEIQRENPRPRFQHQRRSQPPNDGFVQVQHKRERPYGRPQGRPYRKPYDNKPSDKQ